MRIIHLSDIHVGKGKNHTTLKTIRNWILDNKDKHHASVVVITGDIVDDGRVI